MAFCNQCGSKLPDGAKFCSGCGAAVDPTDAPAAAAVAADPSPSSSSAQAVPGPSRAPHITPDPVSTPGRGGIGLILPAIVVLAILVIGYLLLTQRTPDQATANGGQGTETATKAGGGGATNARGTNADAPAAAPVPPAGSSSGSSIYASAAVLDSQFNADPGSAALRYPGPVRVSGIIASMVQPGPTPSLSMEGRTRFNYMVVNFPSGYGDRLLPLSKGQFITVACDDVRSLAGTTILSGCLLA